RLRRRRARPALRARDHVALPRPPPADPARGGERPLPRRPIALPVLGRDAGAAEPIVRRALLPAALGIAALLVVPSVAPFARLQAQSSRPSAWAISRLWGLSELQGYFPRATGAAFVAADFTPKHGPEAIRGPYRSGVLDWPEVVRVRVRDGKVAF